MAKLGTRKRPIIARVATQERAEEVIAICDERGWIAIVGIEPDEPEDISDLERMLSPPQPVMAEEKIGRNEPCSCGSGKKFKKCCGA